MSSGVPIALRPIPVWKPRWGPDQLERKHAEEEGPFTRGFFLVAASEGELTFQNFNDCCYPGRTVGDIQRNNWPAFTGVDLSGEKRKGVAIITLKVNPLTQVRYPCDVRVGAWSANEIAEQLLSVNNLYNPNVIMVEDNGAQKFLVEYIQASNHRYWHKVEPTTTTGQKKNSEQYGLPVLQVEFRNKAWAIASDEFDGISGTVEDHPWKRWAYEFRNHPTASTNDMVMATWFARQGIETFGYTFEQFKAVRHTTAR